MSLHEVHASPSALKNRWELYRLLAEPMRLRVLALTSEEELSVGELAEIVAESQPNVSRYCGPLRQAGLLEVRKQGTRVWVRLADGVLTDPVVSDAVLAGRALCVEDGAFKRVREIVQARDQNSRAFFEKPALIDAPRTPAPYEWSIYLNAVGLLLRSHQVAIDAGTGEGSLLDILAPIFDHVIAFDREPSQLSRCADHIAQLGYSNIELIGGAADSPEVIERVYHVSEQRGADVVFASRFLHHAARPNEAIQHLIQLLKPGGFLVIIDYEYHNDESMHTQGDIWLGFEPKELERFAKKNNLECIKHKKINNIQRSKNSLHSDDHLPWLVMVARTPREAITVKTTSKTSFKNNTNKKRRIS